MSANHELAELVRWALAAELPNSKQIGTHAVGRVLVALATYTDTKAEAFPSTQTIADDVSGLSRRDVRNALDLLQASGHIEDTGKRRGRSIVWRLAGYPADVDNSDRGGYPADGSAGKLAGPLAGTLVGYPASKGSEERKTTRARGWVGCEQHTDSTKPASHCPVCLSEVRSDPYRPESAIGKVWYPDVRRLA